jgi:hypothetical protein
LRRHVNPDRLADDRRWTVSTNHWKLLGNALRLNPQQRDGEKALPVGCFTGFCELESQMIKGRMWWEWLFWLFIVGLVIVLFARF